MNYKNKYLKYKFKYLKLKGGTQSSVSNTNQEFINPDKLAKMIKVLETLDELEKVPDYINEEEFKNFANIPQ